MADEPAFLEPIPPANAAISQNVPPIPTVDASTGQIDQSHFEAPYTHYMIRQKYIFSSGKYQIPVAGPVGTPAAKVRLHAPTLCRYVEWSARRSGLPPVLPAPEATDSNEDLGHAEIDVIPPVPVDGSTNEYTVEGKYWFFRTLPVAKSVDGVEAETWYSNGIPMGRLPWSTISEEDALLLKASFEEGII